MSIVSTKRNEGDVREWKDNHLSPYRKVIKQRTWQNLPVSVRDGERRQTSMMTEKAVLPGLR